MGFDTCLNAIMKTDLLYTWTIVIYEVTGGGDWDTLPQLDAISKAGNLDTKGP